MTRLPRFFTYNEGLKCQQGDQEPISGWQNQFQLQLCSSNYATVSPPFSLMLWVSGKRAVLFSDRVYMAQGDIWVHVGKDLIEVGAVKFRNHDLSSIIG